MTLITKDFEILSLLFIKYVILRLFHFRRLSFGIAERISEILKSKGLTQKDFARLLGKRESEISKWMTGRHNFTTQTIARIETALGDKVLMVVR